MTTRSRTLMAAGVLALAAAASRTASADTVYAAIWRAGTYSNYFTPRDSLDGFKTLNGERKAKNLRLVDLDTYVEGGKRKWIGVWEAGTYANEFSADLDLQSFKQLADERHKQNLRLVDLETYVDGNQRKWAGVWRAGTDANYFSIGLDLAAFKTIAAERHAKNLRLIDIETYTAGGTRQWAGVWRTGTYSNYFSVGLDLQELQQLAGERHGKNLRLVDLEPYTDGTTQKWAGLWRSGTDANYFTVGKYLDSLLPLAEKRHGDGLRMVDIEVYEQECGDTYQLPFDDDADWVLSNGNWDDPSAGHGKGNPDGLQAYAFDFVHDFNKDGIGEDNQNIRAARGGTVYALVAGESGNSWGDGTPKGYNGVGNFVVIDHGDGTFGTYWHLQKNSVKVAKGDKVARGQVLALSGNTGNSSTPHLHFDVRTGWSLGYPGNKKEFPSVKIRIRDRNHACWIPRVGDALASSNK